MAPGGEMFRYPQHFGKNVLRHGSHEWLPYSVDEVRAEIFKHQFFLSRGWVGPKKRTPLGSGVRFGVHSTSIRSYSRVP